MTIIIIMIVMKRVIDHRSAGIITMCRETERPSAAKFSTLRITNCGTAPPSATQTCDRVRRKSFSSRVAIMSGTIGVHRHVNISDHQPHSVDTSHRRLAQISRPLRDAKILLAPLIVKAEKSFLQKSLNSVNFARSPAMTSTSVAAASYLTILVRETGKASRSSRKPSNS